MYKDLPLLFLKRVRGGPSISGNNGPQADERVIKTKGSK